MKEDRVHWIETARDLDALGRRLERVDVFALDTEQDSFYSYRSKICLMQIAAEDQEWIVDVLALDDFAPLRAPFADAARVTVMHAGENDVDLLRRNCELEVRGLFDTMAAAQVLGYRRTGLAGLIEEHFGVVIPKKFQRSDWRRRPLKREQIDYAALDVRYLATLREIFEERLRSERRTPEAHVEFERIERAQHRPRTFNADDYFRIHGASDLDGVERRVLRALFVLRDSIGRREDRAVFRVCGDPVLVDLARRQPSRRDDLRAVKGLSDRLQKKHGGAFLSAVREAIDQGPLERPEMQRRRRPVEELGRAGKRRLDRLRAWRARVAESRDVEPGRVVSTAMLVKLILARPRSRGDLKKAGLDPWRVQEYGAALLRELRD